jgi:hypothetical protein
MAASLEAYADDNTPRQVRHLKEQADRVNLTATRYKTMKTKQPRNEYEEWQIELIEELIPSHSLFHDFLRLRRFAEHSLIRYIGVGT